MSGLSRTLTKVFEVGRVAEPVLPARTPVPGPAPSPLGAADALLATDSVDRRRGDRILAGSIQVRHVDAGSCNGCEVEIVSAFGPE